MLYDSFPPGRAAAMRDVFEAREQLLAEISALPEDAFETRMPGKWSIREILAHLASRDWRFVDGLRLLVAGEPLPWPHPGWHPSQDDLDRWNQEQVRLRADWPLSRVLHELGEARGTWCGMLAGLPDSVFWDERVQQWNARRARHDLMHLPGIRERVRLYRTGAAHRPVWGHGSDEGVGVRP